MQFGAEDRFLPIIIAQFIHKVDLLIQDRQSLLHFKQSLLSLFIDKISSE